MSTETENQDLNLFTSSIELVETAEEGEKIQRAVIKIPIINLGSNSKNLVWTEDTMKKIAPMFSGVPFRYDLNGQNEGSHTKDRLSSPFYDVGWTYKGDKGAYYDPKKKAIYVEGEVTHPEVIAKLQRATSDGRREINFASMGAFIDPKDTKCSICGKSPFGTCEHQRGETYNGKQCGMIPTNIRKALHVALTNDPADKIAEIEQAVFQDMTNQIDSSSANSPVPVSSAGNTEKNLESDESKLLMLIKKLIQEEMKNSNPNHVEVAEMEANEKKKKLEKERLAQAQFDAEARTENVADEQNARDDSKVVNNEEDNPTENEKQKDKKKAEAIRKKLEQAPVAGMEVADDSEKKKEESAEEPKKDSVEEESEDKDKKKKKVKESEEENPKVVAQDDSEEEEEEEVEDEEESEEEEDEDEDVEAFQEEGGDAFKITGPAERQSQPVVETASNEGVNYAEKYKKKIMLEVADNFIQFGKAKSKEQAILMLQDKSIEQLELYQDAFDGVQIQKSTPKAAPKKELAEFHDNHATNKFADEVPEFGGTVRQDPFVEVSDMSADQRSSSFGVYGKFDVCFNPHNAPKYRK